MKIGNRVLSLIICFLLVSLSLTVAFAESSDQKKELQFTETDGKIVSVATDSVVYVGKGYLFDLKCDKSRNVSVSSSEKSVINVNDKGYMTAVKPGQSIVEVKVKNKETLLFSVKINVYVKSVQGRSNLFSFSGVKAVKGKKIDFSTASMLYNGDKYKVKWKGTDEVPCFNSSNSLVADVSCKGNVAIKGVGSATITAGADNYTFSQNVISENFKYEKDIKLSKKQKKALFKKSAFIGNSVTLGMGCLYLDLKPKSYSKAKVIATESYSFYSDNGKPKNMLKYKGKAMKAPELIRAGKFKKVFISMGTNDLFDDFGTLCANAKRYYNSIARANPDVQVYVCSVTPIYKSGQKKGFTNKKANKFNKFLKKYALKKKNFYYIDISTPLKGKNGCMKKAYSSDRYVHMVTEGYDVWYKTVEKYLVKQYKSESLAGEAIANYLVTGSLPQREYCCQLINNLENKKLKKELLNKIK